MADDGTAFGLQPSDDAAALSEDQTRVLWALSLSDVPLGQPATPAMVAQGMAAAYGGPGGDPEIIQAHLRTMVEPGFVERHISDAGEEFSMTPRGWGAIGI